MDAVPYGQPCPLHDALKASARGFLHKDAGTELLRPAKLWSDKQLNVRRRCVVKERSGAGNFTSFDEI